MDKRILWGCLAALATMLGFDLLTQLSGWKLDGPVRTPFGMIFVGGAVSTFAAMTLGGWIARRNFRWIAVALSVVVWVAIIAMLYAIAMPGGAAAMISLAGILKFNAFAIALSLVASWLGAV
ncbi:MAG: hypothetical protein ACREPE_06855, partial [Lysobacter sp.]